MTSRGAQVGNDDQLVLRNLDIEILQIVFTRLFDDEIAHKRRDDILGLRSPVACKSQAGLSLNASERSALTCICFAEAAYQAL